MNVITSKYSLGQQGTVDISTVSRYTTDGNLDSTAFEPTERIAAGLSELYQAIGWNASGIRTASQCALALDNTGVFSLAMSPTSKLVAFARVPFDPFVSCIFDVMVHPDYRRFGLASCLLKSINDVLDSEGRFSMLIDGSGYPTLYTSAGYQLAETERVMYRSPPS